MMQWLGDRGEWLAGTVRLDPRWMLPHVMSLKGWLWFHVHTTQWCFGLCVNSWLERSPFLSSTDSARSFFHSIFVVAYHLILQYLTHSFHSSQDMSPTAPDHLLLPLSIVHCLSTVFHCWQARWESILCSQDEENIFHKFKCFTTKKLLLK